MLPTSVRRVVAAAPQAGSLASSLVSSAPRATAASVPLLTRGHQRRCSSSKPSRSDNGSSDIPADQSVAASSSTRGQGKASGDKRKRKYKQPSDREAAFKKLPSVPNTHHMVGEALGLSSFFSLHRPISITQTMPKTVTDEQFASIFAPRTRANRVADTMSTLSSTIDQLEGPMAEMTIDAHHDQGPGEGMHKMQFRNADGTESSIYVQVDAMSGEFLPFRPPPLPQPQQVADADAAALEVESTEEAPQHRVYKAVFTIEEATEPDGQIRIVAHSPRIIQDKQPRSFLERLAQRQLKFDESQGRSDMHAISVRRQRKLRMKKKKYKKLMRRTRTLRRKLDRT
jgi:hypothetical protein